MYFSAGLLAIGSAMPVPCLRSFLSKQVESSELGILFNDTLHYAPYSQAINFLHTLSLLCFQSIALTEL